MMVAPGYVGATAAKGPVSSTVPSTITTAPAGITPDAPRRGSVIAYAPRMIMVSVISLHPLQFGTPAGRARTNPSPYPGTAIALFSTLAHAVMIIMLLLLPEARGR